MMGLRPRDVKKAERHRLASFIVYDWESGEAFHTDSVASAVGEADYLLNERRKRADEGWSDDGLVVFRKIIVNDQRIIYVPFEQAVQINTEQPKCPECDEVQGECECEDTNFGEFDYLCDYEMKRVFGDHSEKPCSTPRINVLISMKVVLEQLLELSGLDGQPLGCGISREQAKDMIAKLGVEIRK